MTPKPLAQKTLSTNHRGHVIWPRMEPGDHFLVDKEILKRFTTYVNWIGCSALLHKISRGLYHYEIISKEHRARLSLQKFDTAKPITRESAPRTGNGKIQWKAVLDGFPGGDILLQPCLSAKLLSQACRHGFTCRRVGISPEGYFIVRMTRRNSGPTVRDKILSDLANLPDKWLVAIHDGIAAKGKITPLTKEEREAVNTQ